MAEINYQCLIKCKKRKEEKVKIGNNNNEKRE